MTNFLTLIPAAYRLYLYMAYAFVGVVIGGIDVAFQAAEVMDPTWFDVTQKVYAYLAIPLGLTAASNVTRSDTPPPAPLDNPLRSDGGNDLPENYGPPNPH